MRTRFSQFIIGSDIFGYQIGVTYRGDSAHKTKLGSFVTFIVYGLILTNLIQSLNAFGNGSRQSENQTTKVIDRHYSEPYNLAENHF